MTDECGNCRFWRERECRVKSPVLILCEAYGDEPQTCWPDVEFDKWCGEWQPIKAAADDCEVPFDSCLECKRFGQARTEQKCERGKAMGYFNCIDADEPIPYTIEDADND